MPSFTLTYSVTVRPPIATRPVTGTVPLEVTPVGMTVTLVGNAGARSGNLYIHSPRPLELRSASGCEATLTAEKDSILRVAVRDRARDVANRIELTVR